MARTFGEIPNVPPGTVFATREELSKGGVHRPPQAGISGAGAEGADSIVVSGGYEDDEDFGDFILYTGHGGKDPATGKQVADQLLERGNLALARSSLDGLPVRVVRGAGGDPAYAPASGYRYEGLFFVQDFWTEPGKSGFGVWRFRLVKTEDTGAVTLLPSGEQPGGPPPRIEVSIQQLVRSTAVAQRVKELHGHQCQVCGLTLQTVAGPYAQAAHIRPLGRPHDGPDVAANVLCLCPNDHVRFDTGGLSITDNLEVVSFDSTEPPVKLRTVPGHNIDLAQIQYHRTFWNPET